MGFALAIHTFCLAFYPLFLCDRSQSNVLFGLPPWPELKLLTPKPSAKFLNCLIILADSAIKIGKYLRDDVETSYQFLFRCAFFGNQKK